MGKVCLLLNKVSLLGQKNKNKNPITKGQLRMNEKTYRKSET